MPSITMKKQYHKKFRKAHPGYSTKYVKRFRKAHPNYDKEWIKAHPGYSTKYVKRFRKAHPGYALAKSRAYRYKKHVQKYGFPPPAIKLFSSKFEMTWGILLQRNFSMFNFVKVRPSWL